jgi:hypothetical protein
MKVERIDSKEEVFIPKTLEITFENQEELFDIWHRLNISHNDFYEFTENTNRMEYDVPKPEKLSIEAIYDFFVAVDDMVEEERAKKNRF